MESEVVEEMLRFLYRDEVSNLKEVAEPLLVAAEKNDNSRLSSLHVMCENEIMSSLNVDNSARILILADLHKANHQKKMSARFITEHLEVNSAQLYNQKLQNFHQTLIKSRGKTGGLSLETHLKL